MAMKEVAGHHVPCYGICTPCIYW